MKKSKFVWLKKFAWIIYLAFVLAYFDIFIWSWAWWIIVIPILVLEAISVFTYEQEFGEKVKETILKEIEDDFPYNN